MGETLNGARAQLMGKSEEETSARHQRLGWCVGERARVSDGEAGAAVGAVERAHGRDVDLDGGDAEGVRDGEDGVVRGDTIEGKVATVRAKEDDGRGSILAGCEVGGRGRCVALSKHQGDSEGDKCDLHFDDLEVMETANMVRDDVKIGAFAGVDGGVDDGIRIYGYSRLLIDMILNLVRAHTCALGAFEYEVSHLRCLLSSTL